MPIGYKMVRVHDGDRRSLLARHPKYDLCYGNDFWTEAPFGGLFYFKEDEELVEWNQKWNVEVELWTCEVQETWIQRFMAAPTAASRDENRIQAAWLLPVAGSRFFSLCKRLRLVERVGHVGV